MQIVGFPTRQLISNALYHCLSAPAEPKSEEKSGPKMNVISRGAADSPKTVPKKTLVPAEEPSTDF